MPQEGQPRLDHEPVARQAAIGADALEHRHMAVQRARLVAAELRQQIDAHRLAEQGGRIELRVVRQRRQLDTKTAAIELFAREQTLGQQHVLAQRRR